MSTVEEVKHFKSKLDEALKHFQFYTLLNKQLPLDQRWEDYLKVCRYLPIGGYIDEFTVKHLGMDHDRRGIVWYDDLDDWANEEPGYDEWREKVLATGQAGFEWDW